MFLNLSVILFTGEGGNVWQTPPWQTPTWADTPLGKHPLGQTPLGQTLPLGQTADTATVADGTHPTGMHSSLV